MAALAPNCSKAVLLSFLVLSLSIGDARQDFRYHTRKLAQECPELTIVATGESVCNTAVVPDAPNSTSIRFTARTTATSAPSTTYSVTPGVVCPSAVPAPRGSIWLADNDCLTDSLSLSAER